MTHRLSAGNIRTFQRRPCARPHQSFPMSRIKGRAKIARIRELSFEDRVYAILGPDIGQVAPAQSQAEERRIRERITDTIEKCLGQVAPEHIVMLILEFRKRWAAELRRKADVLADDSIDGLSVFAGLMIVFRKGHFNFPSPSEMIKRLQRLGVMSNDMDVARRQLRRYEDYCGIRLPRAASGQLSCELPPTTKPLPVSIVLRNEKARYQNKRPLNGGGKNSKGAARSNGQARIHSAAKARPAVSVHRIKPRNA